MIILLHTLAKLQLGTGHWKIGMLLLATSFTLLLALMKSLPWASAWNLIYLFLLLEVKTLGVFGRLLIHAEARSIYQGEIIIFQSQANLNYMPCMTLRS